jgi:hypothetical protein
VFHIVWDTWQRVLLRHYASRRKVTGLNSKEVIEFYEFTQNFQPHYGPGVDSDSNRNEYQEFSCGVKRDRRVRLGDLRAIYEPILQKMCDDWRLTVLQLSDTCCKDSCTLYSFLLRLVTPTKQTPWPLVCKRTIPTEWPLLVGQLRRIDECCVVSATGYDSR